MRLLSRTDFEHGLKEWLNGSIASASEINAAGVKTVHPADWQLREEPFTKHIWIERLNKAVFETGNASTTESPVRDIDSEIHDELQDVIEDPDEVILVSDKSRVSNLNLFVDVYVAYSPVYGVPVLYFRGRDTDGSVVPLARLVESSLFNATKSVYPLNELQLENGTIPKENLLSQSTREQRADKAYFPAITQGEHPQTGLPCFYLHPCETSTALSEILGNTASNQQDWTPCSLLQSWFMLISTLMDIKQ